MRSNNKVGISFLIIALLVIGLMVVCPQNLENTYYYNYLVDSICLVGSVSTLLWLYINNQLDIFEPITVVAFVYIIMYFVTPIYDLCVGEITWYGYDLFQYGIKATLIAFAGYITFYLFYVMNFVIGKRKLYFYNTNTEENLQEGSSATVSIILILLMYGFCFAANVYYMSKSNGNNLVYILSLGLMGEGGTVQTTDASIGFVSMFSYSLPAITLLYWEYGTNRLMKILLFVPMLMLQVARGFRFFVIQIAITFFAYVYIKKKERPKIHNIILAAVVLMVPVLLMTLFRNSIRGGEGMDLSTINSDTIKDAFDAAVWDNFRIYKNLYGMVDAIPSRFPYVYGRQIILGTIYMVIPRIIWPGKLSSYGGEGLAVLIGGNIGAGQAYPNIGEYYYAAGVAGVIFFMSIYGLWMKSVRNRWLHSPSGLDIITYSVLLGSNLQLIIRGYTPSNFWYVVFAVLPVWIARKFVVWR